MSVIYRSDNTAAFGNTFLTIEIDNSDLYKISKILFVVNDKTIIKTFTDENFFQRETVILSVNFDSDETMKLLPSNIGRVLLYDENNYQLTCPQSIEFNARNGVIVNARFKG